MGLPQEVVIKWYQLLPTKDSYGYLAGNMPALLNHNFTITKTYGCIIWPLSNGRKSSKEKFMCDSNHKRTFASLNSSKFLTFLLASSPGGPSARSGHRMVCQKKHLFVFGGFHDNTRDYKYFNDVHIFDLENYVWKKITPTGMTKF